MAKRTTTRGIKRAAKKQRKEAAMRRGETGPHDSRYGRKNRKQEIARGYSTRPTSPFYLSTEMVAQLRVLPAPNVAASAA